MPSNSFGLADSHAAATFRKREINHFSKWKVESKHPSDTQVELPIDTTALLSNFSFSKDDFPTTKPRSISHSTRETTVLIQ
ncbi:hypothetical protein CDAR_247221 [Caerostris darwini]|uniref:Uncharacterized protein n=1 Tax=Caerostris darwini TaxID=1538125 RepID=A0AAV4X3A7_9ARAC|nr:hypothetical protein CDAR_247221 [Caerostris darwini]